MAKFVSKRFSSSGKPSDTMRKEKSPELPKCNICEKRPTRMDYHMAEHNK